MPLIRTHRNWAAFFCRAALAGVFIPHGLDKLYAYPPLGWAGPDAWAAQVVELLHYEWMPLEYKIWASQASAWTEVIAGGLCVVGLLVRLAMIPLMINIGAAIALVSAKNGFWINHTVGGVPAPGFEYHMVLLLVAFGLLCSGAGSLSLDKLISSEPEIDEYEEEYIYEEDDEDDDGDQRR